MEGLGGVQSAKSGKNIRGWANFKVSEKKKKNSRAWVVLSTEVRAGGDPRDVLGKKRIAIKGGEIIGNVKKTLVRLREVWSKRIWKNTGCDESRQKLKKKKILVGLKAKKRRKSTTRKN